MNSRPRRPRSLLIGSSVCEYASVEPAAVDRVVAVMRRGDFWWGIAGGWAIDLWLGEQTREHHDIEVVVRRDDQTVVWDALHDEWELSCIDPPNSRLELVAPP